MSLLELLITAIKPKDNWGVTHLWINPYLRANLFLGEENAEKESFGIEAKNNKNDYKARQFHSIMIRFPP